jgi:hypothetical protein
MMRACCRACSERGTFDRCDLCKCGAPCPHPQCGPASGSPASAGTLVRSPLRPPQKFIRFFHQIEAKLIAETLVGILTVVIPYWSV